MYTVCLSFFFFFILFFFFVFFFLFLMIRRPPRSTLDRSSAASDVYKRQRQGVAASSSGVAGITHSRRPRGVSTYSGQRRWMGGGSVSYTHLRAHETVLDLVCRLLLEKKKEKKEENRRYRDGAREQTENEGKRARRCRA